MQKIHVGREGKRQSIETANEPERIGRWLTVVGAIGAAVMLVLPMRSSETVDGRWDSNAVAVMSMTGKAEREELVMPDQKTYAPEEESIFEDIGAFFAEMIFGEG